MKNLISNIVDNEILASYKGVSKQSIIDNGIQIIGKSVQDYMENNEMFTSEQKTLLSLKLNSIYLSSKTKIII